jgi:transcriptional regulator with XRE-family HTH domain
VDNKFAENLRIAREKKELSQADLADRTGLQPSAISHFEAGRRSPSFDNLKRLADALNVPIDSLLGRESKHQVEGPVAEKLFRNFEKLSAADQETLSNFAKMLAEQNARKKGG